MQKLKQEVAKLLKKVVDLEEEEILKLIEEPPSSELGDIAFPCFSLSKKLKLAPQEIAQDLARKIEPSAFIKEVKAINGYLNFFVDWNKFGGLVVEEILKEKYSLPKKEETILIEHTSVNPSGPINVGRIRNTFIGDTLVRLYRFLGYKVRVHYLVNDVGRQIAIIAWGRERGIEPDKELMEKFEKYKNRSDFQTMFIYVPANQEVEKNEKAEKEVRELLQRCESGETAALRLLRNTAEFCLEGQKRTLERLGVKIDSFDFESKLLETSEVRKTFEMLKKLPEYKCINGLHVLDLSKYGFERRGEGTVIQRSDGTSVYITRDIAYHLYKLSLAKKNINVLGEDHKIEAQELKKILELLGALEGKELHVVFFSFVNIKGKRLSTRRGETLPVDTFLDEGAEKATELIKKRYDLPEEEMKRLAESIAIAALRYSELRVSPSKPITFDWDEALAFEGETGPYLQYSLVRAKKILEKCEDVKFCNLILNEKEEIELLRLLSKFVEVIKTAAENYNPSILANYTYKLASQFSKFYESCPVIQASGEKRNTRILLVKTFVQIMKECLHLLGIPEVEKM